MSHINFRPWVGKNYLSQGYKGKRIFILGESHYCNELCEGGKCYPLCKREKMKEDCFSQTEDVLETFVYSYSGESYEQTFLCFERAILGKKATQEEREELWDGVVFYNYLQFDQADPRKPIMPEYWAESELAFKEMLEEYMPDYIIVWGVRLYEGLPDWGGKHSLLQISENDSTDVWTYTIQGKKISALLVHHPSSPTGKSWSYWHEVYEKFWKFEAK